MDADSPEDRKLKNLEIVSVGLGKYDHIQDVVILSYTVDDEGSVFANIINIDPSTKRQVPAELILPYHAPKGTIPG